MGRAFLYLCRVEERSRIGCSGRCPRRSESVFCEAPNTARGARALPGRPTLAREAPRQIARRASPSFAGGKPSTHHGTIVRAESAERKWRHEATTDGRWKMGDERWKVGAGRWKYPVRGQRIAKVRPPVKASLGQYMGRSEMRPYPRLV